MTATDTAAPPAATTEPDPAAEPAAESGQAEGAGFEPKADVDEKVPGTEIATMAPVASLTSRIRYARELANAGLLPEQYRNKPGNVLYAVEYGLMLGISPMAAITGIHVIDGKPTASAALMSALVRRAGHRLRIKVTGSVEGGDLKATAMLTRTDDPDWTFETNWTIDRARRAGLVDSYLQGADGKWVVRARTKRGLPGNWETYPEALAKARAISEVVREGCEEVLCGAHYTAEELGAMVDDEGNVLDGEVVSETLTPTVEPEVAQPMHPARAEQMRKRTFEAFAAAADPSALRAPLVAIWHEMGPQAEVTPVVGRTGEATTLLLLVKAAIAAAQAGAPFVDESPATAAPAETTVTVQQEASETPGAPDAPLPASDNPEAAYAADGITDAVLVGEGSGEDGPGPEAEGTPDSRPLTAEPTASKAGGLTPEEARALLLDEIAVIATIFGSTVGQITARQRAHLKRDVIGWTPEEALRFVGTYRKQAVERLTKDGKGTAAQAYGMLGTQVVVNVREMLGDAIG